MMSAMGEPPGWLRCELAAFDWTAPERVHFVGRANDVSASGFIPLNSEATIVSDSTSHQNATPHARPLASAGMRWQVQEFCAVSNGDCADLRHPTH